MIKKSYLVYVITLLFALSVQANFIIRDGKTIPEFVAPSSNFTIQFEGIHSVNDYMYIAGVLSRDKTWNLNEDYLAIYSGGENKAPKTPATANGNLTVADVTIDRTMSTFELYQWRTTLPSEFNEGDTLYLILRGESKSIQYIGSMTKQIEVVIPIYVTDQKGVIFNTATLGEKKATGKLIALKSLESAKLTATPSNSTIYTYNSVSQSVKLETNSSGTIKYTIKREFKPDDSGSFTTSGDVTLTGDDTIVATASMIDMKSVTETWYYKRELPKTQIVATPSDAAPNKYGFSSPTLDVKLKVIDSNGDLIPLSSSSKIYFKKSNGTATESSSDEYKSGDVITINSDDTINAIAILDDYENPSDGSWYYKHTAPQILLRADPSKDNPNDTLKFTISNSIKVLTPYYINELGDEVELPNAKIYYLLDTTGDKGFPTSSSSQYSSAINIDTTVTIRAIAQQDGFIQAEKEWNYKIELEENSLNGTTSIKSYLNGDRVNGDELKNEGDEARWGKTLDIVLHSVSNSIEYKLRGKTLSFNSGDTIHLLQSDPDTVIIPVTASQKGFETINRDLIFVRDTLTGLLSDPKGTKFAHSQYVSLILDGDWKNSTIYFDTTESNDINNYEKYSSSINISSSVHLKAYSKADFAISSKLISERFTLAVGVEGAKYSDHSGDGSIDNVTIKLSKKFEQLPDSIILFSPFDQDEKRVVYKDNISAKNDSTKLSIDLKNPFAFTGSTEFSDKKLGSLLGFEYVDDQFTITDSVAPIIISARYSPGKILSPLPLTRDNDEIHVQFSENVSIENEENPFVLNQGTYSYSLSLSDMNLNKDNATFSVVSIDGVDYPKAGDSIRINEDANIKDESNTSQNNSNNRFVQLLVDDIPYLLNISAVSPINPKTYEIPDELKSSDGNSIGIPIVADFSMSMENGNQDGIIKIFDHVGNIVSESSGRNDGNKDISCHLINSDRTKLVFIWNGKNHLGRDVSSGTYLAKLQISDGRGVTIEKKLIIGISRSN